MHPEVQQEKAGECPKCGMKLMHQTDGKSMDHHESKPLNSYAPLLVVIGLIVLVTVVLSLNDAAHYAFYWQKSMAYFMAGFFLVFSGFKLLDLKGFAEGYATYDLLAQRAHGYGYVYPFIELLLGCLYILVPSSLLLNIFTFLIMSFSGLGVLKSMLQKRKIQCACLGTFLKVPLTKITLIEDFGMAFMALLILTIC